MALHPIVSVLVRRPDLVLEHLAGYASLIQEEVATTGSALLRRAIAWAVAAVAFLVFLVLAGVAAMLAATQQGIHWILLLVPGTALALAIVAFVQARQRLARPVLAELRAQLQADLDILRTLGSA